MSEDGGRIVGWREWVTLPELGIPAIKAKMDTGARTSALHTFRLETFRTDGVEFVRFRIHPIRRRQRIELECVSPVLDQRPVRDSGGHVEERYVIGSLLGLGDQFWPIEITLTNREDMLFRMLIGRSAMKKAGITIDPARSFTTGKRLARSYDEIPRRGPQK